MLVDNTGQRDRSPKIPVPPDFLPEQPDRTLELQRAESATTSADDTPADDTPADGTLGEAVRKALASIEPPADDVVLRVSGGQEVLPGLVDARVARIVSNLVTNARVHGRPPIEIVVHDRSFQVADSGPGVPGWLVERGPQRFAKRVGSSGAGLGLTIASAHASAMGGEIELVPDSPVITVRFPGATEDRDEGPLVGTPKTGLLRRRRPSGSVPEAQ